MISDAETDFLKKTKNKNLVSRAASVLTVVSQAFTDQFLKLAVFTAKMYNLC